LALPACQQKADALSEWKKFDTAAAWDRCSMKLERDACESLLAHHEQSEAVLGPLCKQGDQTACELAKASPMMVQNVRLWIQQCIDKNPDHSGKFTKEELEAGCISGK